MSDPSRPSVRETVSVVGLGYVGLPVAVALAEGGHDVVAFDIKKDRIGELATGHDRTATIEDARLAASGLNFTDDPAALSRADIHIVAVPTPIDAARQPDLAALKGATETVAGALLPGAIVVYESTVYPGATEEVAVPILEAVSGLSFGRDFAVGYSPERINPGDAEHTFETISKVVAASSPDALDRLAALYGSVITAPIHRAPSIRVAEAAKVIENTQRDLNIALMNELAVLFHRLDIDTGDVLAAAGTKWNFLPFKPGLVGGHCIGIDPYYLTHKALEVGHQPQVVLAGRGTNEGMAEFVATSVVRECVRLGCERPPRIIILGATFKPDIRDIRNSKVVDLVAKLTEFGAEVAVADPNADPGDMQAEYGLNLQELHDMAPADAVVLAVGHRAFVSGGGWDVVAPLLKDGRGLVADLSGRLDRATTPEGVTLWRL
ncbi:nucleotide sugar dehydrogenase [Rhodobium gokarnense]|uniref:UDP-N-acetyl-D-galactosamine dehydrogenase n=1 Tax=Rhodobium gokarnense TaxID=364296 RepID=A0ABT3HFS1_9HYPH|nr:nucleotide sugar dehydrogenase [Rhodobium gokarnense]MCW2309247.1 UDP-N-acetyl-D-galactosamine dehydrogenase [Rhodobium gokarnense]